MAVALAHFLLAGTLTQVICEAVYAEDNRTQEAFQLPRLRINSKYKYEVPPYHEIIRYDIRAMQSTKCRFETK